MTRIMVVDDAQSNLLYVSVLIEREGWEAVALQNAVNILEIIHDAPPDIILLDLMMPGYLHGQEVLRILKQDELTKDIPVVAITAAPEQYPREAMLQLGFDEYLAKPFANTEWRDLMKRLLSCGA